MNSIPEPMQLSFDTPKLCECGCGQPAPLITKNNARMNEVKGQPRRFIQHHRRPPTRPTTPIEIRFWSKVRKPNSPGACWLWAAHTNKRGYGRFRTTSDRLIL